MNFTAIDFETANYRPDSACQIGIAVVDGGQIKEICTRLIAPPYGGFSWQNTMLHGISATTIYGQPKFDGLWNDIEKYFKPFGFLIAHNMAFDAQILSSILAFYDLCIHDQILMCSLIMARKAFPGNKSYGLSAMSKKFGIKFNHHDAGEDAYACAELALRIFEKQGVESMPRDFESSEVVQKKLGIKFGELNSAGFNNCRSQSR